MIQLATVERVTSKEISTRTVFTLHSKYYDQDSPLLCQLILQLQSNQPAPKVYLYWDLATVLATYDEETRLLHVANCPYYPSSDYSVTAPRYIEFPANLNENMCGPMNRNGVLCSECADGFGLTSFKYKCANCTNAWYGVSLFLFLEFVPLMLFYLIILAFQISVTSPSMPCFILYCQLITVATDLSIYGEFSSYGNIVFAENRDLRLYAKIVATFHGIFNLDFYLLLPPFCISSQLKTSI